MKCFAGQETLLVSAGKWIFRIRGRRSAGPLPYPHRRQRRSC